MNPVRVQRRLEKRRRRPARARPAHAPTFVIRKDRVTIIGAIPRAGWRTEDYF